MGGSATTSTTLLDYFAQQHTDDYFIMTLVDDFFEYVAALADYYGRLADDYSDHIETLVDDYFYYSSRLQG